MNDWLSTTQREVLLSFGYVLTLVFLIFLDVVSGLLVAFAEKKLNSTISRAGAARKVATLLVVAVAGAFDPIFPNMIFAGLNLNLTGAVCLILMATEGISVLENVSILGVNIPKPLKDALEKVRDLEVSTDSKDSVPVKSDQ